MNGQEALVFSTNVDRDDMVPILENIRQYFGDPGNTLMELGNKVLELDLDESGGWEYRHGSVKVQFVAFRDDIEAIDLDVFSNDPSLEARLQEFYFVTLHPDY